MSTFRYEFIGEGGEASRFSGLTPSLEKAVLSSRINDLGARLWGQAIISQTPQRPQYIMP